MELDVLFILVTLEIVLSTEVLHLVFVQLILILLEILAYLVPLPGRKIIVVFLNSYVIQFQFLVMKLMI